MSNHTVGKGILQLRSADGVGKPHRSILLFSRTATARGPSPACDLERHLLLGSYISSKNYHISFPQALLYVTFNLAGFQARCHRGISFSAPLYSPIVGMSATLHALSISSKISHNCNYAFPSMYGSLFVYLFLSMVVGPCSRSHGKDASFQG